MTDNINSIVLMLFVMLFIMSFMSLYFVVILNNIGDSIDEIKKDRRNGKI